MVAISSAGCLTPLVASEISPWCDIMARAIGEKPFVVDVRASPGATEKNPTLAIQAADMAGGRLPDLGIERTHLVGRGGSVLQRG